MPAAPRRRHLVVRPAAHQVPRATSASPWRLVWSDEFDGPAGHAPNSAEWKHEVGGHGWGNRELEFYTDSTGNASLDGSGNLVIRALHERHGGNEYTSARLITRRAWAYGRFEARLQLPWGQGIWPAFWMIGDNIEKVGWPECGELDVMEQIGREPTKVHGTPHGPGFGGGDEFGGALTLPGQLPFAAHFHRFGAVWDRDRIDWYVDDQTYHSFARANLRPGQRWVFDHPFRILLNVAVGGNWPGAPDSSTQFPQSMKVDYVRVYERRA